MESMSGLFCPSVLNRQKCHKTDLTSKAKGELTTKILD